MNTQENERMVLTVPEAAAMLSLSVRSTYTLCRRADFPTIHLTENRIGVSRRGLEDWIQAQLNAKRKDHNCGPTGRKCPEDPKPYARNPIEWLMLEM